jgi:hypothetical protein
MDEDKKQDILNLLKTGEVKVVFKKVDGGERVMRCTHALHLIPVREESFQDKERTERKKNPDVCPVFDLDKNAWRSFRWDSLTRVSVEIQMDKVA